MSYLISVLISIGNLPIDAANHSKTSENVCPHNRQLPFLQLSASWYEISYDLQKARQNALWFFFMPKRRPPTKKSFNSDVLGVNFSGFFKVYF